MVPLKNEGASDVLPFHFASLDLLGYSIAKAHDVRERTGDDLKCLISD
ncbi:hypothetical protein DSBG_2370 [Desulfosporosinus sp. BG]|nr:hypothetical protein DSBG_2370 [Desulfosporosinus sp. BG]